MQRRCLAMTYESVVEGWRGDDSTAMALASV